MQKSFKRTLSLLLAVLMVMTLFTALPLTAGAEETEPVKFEGMSVSLDNVIRINFVISTTDADNNYFFVNSITQLDCDTNREHFRQEIQKREEWNDNQTVCKYSFEVYAKELADRFLIEYQYYNGNEYISKQKVVCAKDYLEKLAQNPASYDNNNPQDLRNLCYATLNYGAAAQKQFGHHGTITWQTICNADYYEEYVSYRRDNLPLANENVPETYQADSVPAGLGYDSGSQADYSDFNMTYYASSLGLYGDTSYAVCFEMDDYNALNYSLYDSENDRWVISYNYRQIGTVNYGEPDEWGYYEKQGYLYAFSISGIPSNKILDDYQVKFSAYVWDEETEEYKDVEQVYTFSPKTYIAKVINGAGANPAYTDQEQREGGTYNTGTGQSKDELVNTVKAIYDYAVKAKAYFG